MVLSINKQLPGPHPKLITPSTRSRVLVCLSHCHTGNKGLVGSSDSDCSEYDQSIMDDALFDVSLEIYGMIHTGK